MDISSIMPSLDKIQPKTPTLAKVATLIKNKAVKYAPIRTGNLKRKLDSFNRPAGMISKKIENGKIKLKFMLDVAPPGAEYGKWWNDPNVSSTVRNGKTKNVPGSINFGYQAFNDPEVKLAIDTLINGVVDDVVDYLGESIRDF